MYRLRLPARDENETYQAVIKAWRSRQVRAVLLAATPSVRSQYELYMSESAVPSKIRSLEVSKDLGDLLVANYDQLSAGRSNSHLRSELLSNAAASRCPMCDQGQVATLDHYLPKAHYPEFSVMLHNLVPVCHRCNNLKRDLVEEAGGRFLHSYFENPPSTRLLVADICVKGTVEVSYRLVDRTPASDAEANFFFQFRKLRLAEYFQAEAVSELSDRAGSFELYFGDEEDSRAVQDYLFREAKSNIQRHGLNHWKSALFSAASLCSEFCFGGFRALSV